ncbi:hypothetical protein [Streptomyces sp. NPDC047000]|uniref:hypothetical protein n=1 Tax=Streptomyces sp. NPDC047000 TaxID=3155474 RepID=UPI0033F3D10C
MRRTARALSMAVLAGAVLGGGAPSAFADPSAEVSPGTVQPGGDVSVSVSCDPVGAGAPDTVEATSPAFDRGSVRLAHVAAADDDVSGPEYRGTARLTATAGEAAGGTGTPPGAGAGAGAGDRGAAGAQADAVGPDAVGPDAVGPDAVGPDAVGPDAVPEPAGADMAGADTAVPDAVTGTDRAAAVPTATDGAAPDAVGGPAWTVGGTCPGAPGEQGQPWNTTFTVADDDHRAAGDAGEAGVTGSPGVPEATGATVATGPAGGTDASCPKPQPPPQPKPKSEPRADDAVPPPTWTPGPGQASCAPATAPVPAPSTAPGHRSTDTDTPAPVQRGVQAGGGGVFTPSVPALATGAALIAAALGGAVYRLRGRGMRRHR